MSPCVNGRGYPEIAVKQGGARKKYAVHRLVCEAFNGAPFRGAHVDHLDGNKQNNRRDNLEWVTAAENTRRQWRNGLVDLRGDGQPSAKLTKDEALAVKVLADHGFPAKLVGKWFGVSDDTVSAIKGGHRWAETLGTKAA